MKKIAILFILSAVLLPSITRAQNPQNKEIRYDNHYIAQKISTYQKLKRGGFALTAVGVATSVLGVIFLSNATEQDKNSIAFGGLAVVLGTEMVIGGSSMMIAGNRKITQYQRKLQSLSLKPMHTREGANGLCLRVKF